MTPEEQRAIVRDYLERKEQVVARTRDQFEILAEKTGEKPLLKVDPQIRREVEDEYYATLGRHRYTTRDGRTLWLTDEDLEKRRKRRRRKRSRSSRYYGPTSHRDRRKLILWGFNIAVVLMAILVAYFLAT